MNKLFLPLSLLLAGSASAISETLKTLATQEPTRTFCEKLSTEEKAALDDFCVDLEAVAMKKNQELAFELVNLTEKHKKGAQLAKEAMGADQIASQVLLVPVKNQTTDFMNYDDDIFDDIDDIDDAEMIS